MALDALSSFDEFDPLLDKITIEALQVMIPENTTQFSVLHTEPKKILFKNLQGVVLDTKIAEEGWIDDLKRAEYNLQSDIYPPKE